MAFLLVGISAVSKSDALLIDLVPSIRLEYTSVVLKCWCSYCQFSALLGLRSMPSGLKILVAPIDSVPFMGGDLPQVVLRDRRSHCSYITLCRHLVLLSAYSRCQCCVALNSAGCNARAEVVITIASIFRSHVIQLNGNLHVQSHTCVLSHTQEAGEGTAPACMGWKEDRSPC